MPDTLSSSRVISIHALLAESDVGQGQGLHLLHGISIHALLAESDIHAQVLGKPGINFNPRSPCGERHTAPAGEAPVLISIHALLAESDDTTAPSGLSITLFQSTLSLRRATEA